MKGVGLVKTYEFVEKSLEIVLLNSAEYPSGETFRVELLWNVAVLGVPASGVVI